MHITWNFIRCALIEKKGNTFGQKSFMKPLEIIKKKTDDKKITRGASRTGGLLRGS